MLEKWYAKLEKRMDTSCEKTEKSVATLNGKVDGIVQAVDSKIADFDKRIAVKITEEVQKPVAALQSNVDVLAKKVEALEKSSSETKICVEKNLSLRPTLLNKGGLGRGFSRRFGAHET